MSKLSDAYAKLKEALGSDVTGQIATYLADLGSAVNSTDKSLEDVIKESVGRKEKLSDLQEKHDALAKEKDTLQTKLNASESKVTEYEKTKTELDSFKANAEKDTRAKWEEVQKVLKADQKSPLYEKVQKVLQFFKLPKDDKETLDIETIKSNIQVFDQYSATDYFNLPEGDDITKHEKSKGKESEDKEKQDIGESPFKDVFRGFDQNQT